MGIRGYVFIAILGACAAVFYHYVSLLKENGELSEQLTTTEHVLKDFSASVSRQIENDRADKEALRAAFEFAALDQGEFNREVDMFDFKSRSASDIASDVNTTIVELHNEIRFITGYHRPDSGPSETGKADTSKPD